MDGHDVKGSVNIELKKAFHWYTLVPVHYNQHINLKLEMYEKHHSRHGVYYGAQFLVLKKDIFVLNHRSDRQIRFYGGSSVYF